MTGKKFRKGAASFYIVAISTLILVVIATSFATVVINEITRTSNDDLSQSAYDSAMAGVEDAKVAFANYRRCVENGAIAASSAPSGTGAVTCADIMYWMNHPDCYMVGHILGRIPKGTQSEVMISETKSDSGRGSNKLDQAYTCVTIETNLDDYRSDLTATDSRKVIKVELDQVNPNDIDAVKISWFSNRDGVNTSYTNFASGRVMFRPTNTTQLSTPPTVSVQMIQTAEIFTMEQFERSVDNTTNRGTVYLVPVGSKDGVIEGETDTYIYRSNGTIEADALVKSNNKQSANKPFLVYCDGGSVNEYACTATIKLPAPVGGNRSSKTFMFVVSVPYEQPDTDFSLQFVCKTGVSACSNNSVTSVGVGNTTLGQTAGLKDVQIKIDSTGRANDLFRRVETRMESTDSSFAYPYFAIQALGDSKNGEAAIKKYLTGVTTRWP